MRSPLTFAIALIALTLLTLLASTTHVDAASSSDCYAPNAVPVPVWRSLPADQQNTCPRGFYCPFIVDNDNSTWASICPGSSACADQRASGQLCAAQGKYEPIVCPAGWYCPDFRTMLKCPSGSYCPVGSSEAHSCDGVSYCPEGTEYPRFWGGFLWIFFFDALLFVVYHQYTRYLTRQREAQRARDRNSQVVQSVLSQGITARLARLPQFTQNLCRGFDRARVTVKSLEFEFDQLGLVVRKKGVEKVILHGVSGRVRPGRVTAIQGPSGAGKTTFLSVLLNKLDANCFRRGTLLINGQDVTMDHFREIVGYVPQDDVMHQELTVYENILFSAKCRLPKTWTAQQVEQHVEAILTALQLNHVRDSIIGDAMKRGISGGQRKRVNIGMELAAAPLALFLDEPTSGLDSTSSLEVVRLLQNIAQATGITIAMVIHQPRIEIFSTFDDLLFLAPGGRTVYQGPQYLASMYFERELGLRIRDDDNPADLFMDAIADNADAYVRRWAERGVKAVQTLEAIARHQDHYHPKGAAAAAANNDDGLLYAHEEADEDGNSAHLLGGGAAGAAGGAHAHGKQAAAGPSTVIDVTEADAATPAGGVGDGHDAAVERAGSGRRTSGGLGHGISDVADLPSASERGVQSSVVVTFANKTASSVLGGAGATTTTTLAPTTTAGGSGSNLSDAGNVVNVKTATPPSSAPARSAAHEFPAGSVAWDPAHHGASFLEQFVYCHNRSLRQQHARINELLIELLTAAIFGLVMAVGSNGRYRGVVSDPFALISAAPREQAVPQMGLFLCLGITLVSSAAGVSVFSTQIPMYWREAAAGHNKLAFTLGVNVAQLYRCFLCAIHFTFTYHLVLGPYTSFNYMLLIVFALMFTWYGFGEFIAWAYMGQYSALVAIVLSIVWSVCGGYVSAVPQPVQYLSGSRWASEALFWLQGEKMRHVYQLREISADIWGYSLDEVARDIALIFVIGVVWRILAHVTMIGRYRNKQR